jgi:hypothetical protein
MKVINEKICRMKGDKIISTLNTNMPLPLAHLIREERMGERKRRPETVC